MHPVLRHLLDTDFADLKGSKISGQIALTDELINLGLHDLLGQLTKAAAPASDSPAPASAPKPTGPALPDPKLLLQKLQVAHLKYRTEAGRTILEIEAGV